ncbi:MAG: hypothetical protein M3Q10_19005 [Chloroflexota bacterium]|nr:hypothetical protein [Chloroflexota bacterium]
MTDTQAAEPQAGDAVESQADDRSRSQADQSDTKQQDDKAESISLDKARELRQEAANLRKRLKDAETRAQSAESKVQAAEDKDKTEVERLTGERDRLRADAEATGARLRELAVTTALTGAASRAGARYPDLLVDRLAKRAEVDDDLAVINADALVAEAKKQYPGLFQVVEGKGDGGKRDQDDRGANIKPGLPRMRAAYETDGITKRRR